VNDKNIFYEPGCKAMIKLYLRRTLQRFIFYWANYHTSFRLLRWFLKVL